MSALAPGAAARGLADIYTGGYAGLRERARSADPDALQEVARQFEAYFVQQMLKSMRDASFGDPLLDSHAARTYRDLFDQQVSLKLAERGGIGFAALLRRGLEAELGLRASASPVVPAPPPPPPRAVADEPAPPAPAEVRAEPAFHSPDAFVDALLPHARQAARALDVSPQVLLAQAALETGWGRHVLARTDGASSFNLFGIKADTGWSGPRVVKETLEHEAGVFKKVRAQFRAYDSVEESFRDYVQLISGSARYRDIAAGGVGAEDYARGLQRAGYATDPRYAEKILTLLERDPLRGI